MSAPRAITFGDISRLLINVPPGFMKSLCLNVFWPAWEWGPMNMPYLRALAFSYAQKTERRSTETAIGCALGFNIAAKSKPRMGTWMIQATTPGGKS
jgi:hypothetical protein